MEMPTGYDLLEHSHGFRMHMLRRLIGAFIDIVVIFIPVIIIIYILKIESKDIIAGIVSGFGWFFYSVLFEGYKGTTLGKRVTGHIVVSLNGPMTYTKAIIRNVPKIFWYLFLPVDFFVGLSISKDPRQRWTDGVANTSIIKVE